MEIQYAMFFKSINDKATVFQNPINKIGVSNVHHFQKIRLPLIVTFMGGDEGKHLLNIIISPRGQREAAITQDFRFDWPSKSLFLTKVFGLEFKPNFHTIYDFTFEVDGQKLGNIPLPIVKQGI